MTDMETRVEEGKRLARERRALLTPEQLAKVEAMENDTMSFVRRFFVGPADDKGRQPGRMFTEEEVAEWEAAHGKITWR